MHRLGVCHGHTWLRGDSDGRVTNIAISRPTSPEPRASSLGLPLKMYIMLYVCVRVL